eukprot:707366-Hanusia_phi.AAC.3
MQRLLVDGGPGLAQLSHVLELGPSAGVKVIASPRLGVDLSVVGLRLDVLPRLLLHLLLQLSPLLLQLLLVRSSLPGDRPDVRMERVHVALELVCHPEDGPCLLPPHQLFQQRRVVVQAVELGLGEAMAVPVVEVRVGELGVHEEERVGPVESQRVDEVVEGVLHRHDVNLVHVL